MKFSGLKLALLLLIRKCIEISLEILDMDIGA